MLLVIEKLIITIILTYGQRNRPRFQFHFNRLKQADFGLSAGKCKDHGDQPFDYEKNYSFVLFFQILLIF